MDSITDKRTLLVVLAGLATGLGLNFAADNYSLDLNSSPETTNLSERVAQYENSEIISENPQLESVRLSVNLTSGNVWSPTGQSERVYDSNLRVGLGYTNWRDWENWEGNGNYSNEYEGFGAYTSFLNSRETDYLRQNVSVPQRGLSVFHVEAYRFSEALSCDTSQSRLVVSSDGQKDVLVEKMFEGSEIILNASLEEYAGQDVSVGFEHDIGESCGRDRAEVEVFKVVNYYND